MHTVKMTSPVFVRGAAVGALVSALLTALFLATVWSGSSVSVVTTSEKRNELSKENFATATRKLSEEADEKEKRRVFCPPCETSRTSPIILQTDTTTDTTTTEVPTTLPQSIPAHVVIPMRKCSNETFSDLPKFDLHPYTMRGFADHVRMVHPLFFNMTDAMKHARHDFRLLDIGTGSGRTLLDIQQMHPIARLVGTNHLDYEVGKSVSQALKDEDLLAVAKHFNITVFCDAFRRPFLPRISFLDVNSPHLNDVFRNSSFDFMISLLALNGPSKTVKHPYLSTLVEKLAPGGVAILHAGDAMFPRDLMNELGNFSAIGSLTATRKNRIISVVMYVKMSPFLHLWQTGEQFYFVNCMIKVCPPSFQPTADQPDCILPVNTTLRGLDFLVEKNTHVWDIVKWSLTDFIENVKKLKG